MLQIGSRYSYSNMTVSVETVGDNLPVPPIKTLVSIYFSVETGFDFII
jgi:hypothetical protein